MTSIAVNGAPVDPKIENGYAVITRNWKAGDKINFELPMKPQRVKAIEQVAADRGLVAVKYGPLVYNFEAADNPQMEGRALADAEIRCAINHRVAAGAFARRGRDQNTGRRRLAAVRDSQLRPQQPQRAFGSVDSG